MHSFFGWFKKKNEIPNFLIIGVQKAGTTALYEYLSMHPQIKATTPKELHFFNSDIRYAKGLEYYHSLFPSIDNNILTFDASSSYLSGPNAYRRIHEYNPNIKMIVLLRDPTDRAYSAWNMYKSRYRKNYNWFFDDWLTYYGNGDSDKRYIKRSNEELYDFERFVSNEIEKIGVNLISAVEAPVISLGFYHAYLTKYLSLFKREQILVIESSYFREHTKTTLKQVVILMHSAIQLGLGQIYANF